MSAPGPQCDIGILFDDVVSQGQQGLAGASCVHLEIKRSHRPITKIGVACQAPEARQSVSAWLNALQWSCCLAKVP
jgi:hypothetical protein